MSTASNVCQASPTSEPSNPTVKVPNKTHLEQISHIFNTIIEYLALVLLHLEYYLNRLSTRLASLERKTLFKGNIISISGNHGKKEDIPKFRTPPPFTPNLEKQSQYGLKMEGSIKIDPFGEGVCLGGTLVCCKKWLETNNIQEVAKTLEGGVPYEAVLMQAYYENLMSSQHYTLLEELLKTLVEWHQKNPDKNSQDALSQVEEILKKQNSSIQSSYRSLMQATCDYIFLSSPKPTYCNFMVGQLGKKVDENMYSTFRRISNQLEPNGFDKQFEYDAINVTASLVQCRIDQQILYDVSYKELLETISTLSEGAYVISTPLYDPLGRPAGHHVYTLINDKNNTSYLYEGNIAIGSASQGAQSLVKSTIEVHCGEYPDEKTSTLSKILKRVGHFFSLQANPPLFGEISHTFGLYRICLTS